MENETQEIGTVLTTLLNRLDQFYSYQDLNQFDGPSKKGNITMPELLHFRNEWYKNTFHSILQNHREIEKGKSVLESIRLTASSHRKKNESHVFESTLQFSIEDKELIHAHLKFLEDYLYKMIYSELSIETKKENIGTANLRGKSYSVLNISQKVLLVRYLTEHNLFPPKNLMKPTDQYIISLSVLFNASGTNISKKFKYIEDKLKEFNKRKKEERISLDKYSPSLHKDVKAVIKWLQAMGLSEIATKMDNELLA
jgi:ribosomal protein L33